MYLRRRNQLLREKSKQDVSDIYWRRSSHSYLLRITRLKLNLINLHDPVIQVPSPILSMVSIDSEPDFKLGLIELILVNVRVAHFEFK